MRRVLLSVVGFVALLAMTFALTGAGGGADRGLDLPVTNPAEQEPAIPSAPIDIDPIDPRDLDYPPPPIFFGEVIASEEDSLVFVIDGSGSMTFPANGARRGKMAGERSRWEVVREELKRSIAGLAPKFKFNIIKYSCSMVTLFEEPALATAPNKATATAWLDSFVETLTTPMGIQGFTATGPGVALALAWKTNEVVILLTDGEPNCPWGNDSFGQHRQVIRTHNTQGATIDVFGINASGNYRAFCQGIAADSGGNYYDVAPSD